MIVPKTQEQKRIDGLDFSGSSDCVGKYADSKKRATIFQPVDGGNEAKGCDYVTVSGQGNQMLNCQSGTAFGVNNVAGMSRSSIVGGEKNNVGNMQKCLVVANNSKNNGSMNCVWLGGESNMIYGPVLDSIVFGQNLMLSNVAHCLAIGDNSGTSSGLPYFNCSGYSRMTFHDGLIESLDRYGNLKVSGSFGTLGADYAEYFEWVDGNPDNEDRRGRFVRLIGDKIELASRECDDIIGVVSAVPSVVGNDCETEWHGRYIRDAFGKLITEPDDSGELHPVENDEYDSTAEYIPRSKRPEWSPVGLVGQLVAVDDGSCTAGWYATVGSNGIAVKAECRTQIRVMSRIDDTHIKIFIK